MKGCQLFDPKHGVRRVGYEAGPYRAFEDVAVEYAVPISDQRGGTVSASFFSIKHSQTFQKAFTAAALSDPALISATSVSLLEQLRDAVHKMANSGDSHLFTILSPWGIAQDDSLIKLVRTNDGALRLEVLFDGTGRRGEMGALRHAWTELLGLSDEEELRPILDRLRIASVVQNFNQHREELNFRLCSAGLSPVPLSQRVVPYFGLVHRMVGEGVTWFDAKALRAICEQEKLLGGCAPAHANPNAMRIGVRTFLRWAEGLDGETDDMLCLAEHFDGRLIRQPSYWQERVIPGVTEFLTKNIRSSHAYELHLHCVGSVAFLAGYLLEPGLASAASIAQRQYGKAPEIWHVDTSAVRDVGPGWEFTAEKVGEGHAVAVAAGMTHSIGQDVVAHCRAHLPEVGTVLIATPKGGPSYAALKGGTHAFALAEQLKIEIGTLRAGNGTRRAPVHLFWAAPNSFAFYLGQVSRPLGAVRLYEFDFTGTQEYVPSLDITPAVRLAGGSNAQSGR